MRYNQLPIFVYSGKNKRLNTALVWLLCELFFYFAVFPWLQKSDTNLVPRSGELTAALIIISDRFSFHKSLQDRRCCCTFISSVYLLLCSCLFFLNQFFFWFERNNCQRTLLLLIFCILHLWMWCF